MRITGVCLLACCLLATPLAAQRVKEAPPGTIRLNDSVYIDEQPVTNAGYAAFLACVEGFWNHGFSDSLSRYPETRYKPEELRKKFFFNTQWRLNQQALLNRMRVERTPYQFVDSSLTLAQYLTHEVIRDFPVLHISLEQAVNYCKWRTDMVRMWYAEKNNTDRKKAKHFGYIAYRLPLAAEWMAAHRDKGLMGKRLQNKQPETLRQKKDQFTVYPLPVAEWMEPLDPINKLAVTNGGKVVDITVPPTETYVPEMGFRCSCDVKN